MKTLNVIQALESISVRYLKGSYMPHIFPRHQHYWVTFRHLIIFNQKFGLRTINFFQSHFILLTGVSLQICPTGPTCCTPDMEERLNDWSAAQYREALSRKTDEMATPFRNKASKLDGNFSLWFFEINIGY